MTTASQPLQGIDHVAMTVADVDATCAFYDRLFGMTVLSDHKPQGRTVVRVIQVGGGVRLSIHQAGNGVELVAVKPTVGSVDICFRWNGSPQDAVDLLTAQGIAIADGPSPRPTAEGRPSLSVYFRDIDGNLVELMAADWRDAA
jgi:catechol 2,3-dioxygenase-like lactoylglutathione lyase family enzyme